MKQHPAARRHLRRTGGSQSILMPNFSSTSAPPTLPLIARLPCFATGTPAAAAIRAAPVEMLKVPALSPPVPQVSRRPSTPSLSERARRRIARAHPAISSPVSPFILSAIRNAPARISGTSPSSTSPKARSASSAESAWRARTASYADAKLFTQPLVSKNCSADVFPPACRSTRDETARPRRISPYAAGPSPHPRRCAR